MSLQVKLCDPCLSALRVLQTERCISTVHLPFTYTFIVVTFIVSTAMTSQQYNTYGRIAYRTLFCACIEYFWQCAIKPNKCNIFRCLFSFTHLWQEISETTTASLEERNLVALDEQTMLVLLALIHGWPKMAVYKSSCT